MPRLGKKKLYDKVRVLHRYGKIRAVMAEHHVKLPEFAAGIYRSIAYTEKRLLGYMPWDLDDVYNILKYFNLPAERMHEYFPERYYMIEMNPDNPSVEIMVPFPDGRYAARKER